MPFEEKNWLTREYFVDFSLFIGVRVKAEWLSYSTMII